MERLIKIGQVQPKKSIDVRHSKIGLGFEKLDRDVFDPEKAYPFVALTGAKWARLQSGWQRTEKEKGVYDFSWLDSIVDNMRSIGLEPWICLCYGNSLYSPWAAEHFGAVGCAPVKTLEERTAWSNYVKALVSHYKGRVHYYEVWNEPDAEHGWKCGGPNAKELGEFNIATAKACKEADPTCEVLGFCTCRNNRFNFLDYLCETGVCNYLDGITYHCYKIHDDEFAEAFEVYDDVRNRFNPKLKIVQGESGTQSRSDGNGALRKAAWTPLKQAKFLLRHLLVDIGCGVEFTSYFSCMDMIEALNGKVGDVNSYLDYGYFGVVGADFDENGHSTGEYTPKMSFKALQNLCSVFCNEYEQIGFPCEGTVEYSRRVWGHDDDFNEIRHYGYRKPNGSRCLCYWNSKSNILTQTYESTISLRIPNYALDGEIRLVDLLTGDIYELPETMVKIEGQFTKLVNIPVTDYPLLLTIGDFVD